MHVDGLGQLSHAASSVFMQTVHAFCKTKKSTMRTMRKLLKQRKATTINGSYCLLGQVEKQRRETKHFQLGHSTLLLVIKLQRSTFTIMGKVIGFNYPSTLVSLLV